jgi:hypothetical protein
MYKVPDVCAELFHMIEKKQKCRINVDAYFFSGCGSRPRKLKTVTCMAERGIHVEMEEVKCVVNVFASITQRMKKL